MNNKLFCLIFGIILFSGIVLAANSSLISTTTDATPFWTNATSNPINISLNNSQSQVVTFYVKPTGQVGTSYSFFGFVNSTLAGVTSAISQFFTFTIVDLVSPVITFITSNNTQTTNSSILVEANVTDVSTTMMYLNDSSLVGYWTAENGAVDSSVYGNDGTFNGDFTNISSGKFGSKYFSDGIGDYVEIPDSASLRASNLTLAAWIYPTGVHIDSGRIIEKGWGGAPTYASYIFRWGSTGGGEDKNRIYFDIGKTGGYVSTRSVTNDFNDKWTYVVGTYDHQSFKIYINGVLENTTSETNDIIYSTTSLFLGRYNGAAGYEFNGSMDEVMIFNRSLSATEIQSLYNATAQRFNSTINLVLGNNSVNLVAKDTSANVDSKIIFIEKTIICQNNLTNVSTAWTNISCLSTNLMNQTRNVTTYDVNSCGNYTNTTIVEYQATQYCQFDTEAPVLTLSNYSGYINDSVSLQLSATDNVNISYWSINNTGNFSINQSGFITNITSLASGNYSLNVTVNDTSNNLVSGVVRIEVKLILDIFASQIAFVSPTPINNFNTTNTSVMINVSISESNLKNLSFNWNGTSTSIYDDSLLLMYNFDSYTLLNDTSKYGNNATNFDAVYNISGKYGGAYSFNGNGSYLYLSNFNNVPSSYLTLSVWIKTSSNSPQDIITQGRSVIDADTEYIFSVVSGKVTFWDYDAVQGYNANSSGLVNDGNWHLVSFVKSSTSGYFYIDGVLDSNFTAAKNCVYSSNDFSIGKDYRDNTFFFNGSMDEVRIYNRSLSALEIKGIYDSNLAKYNSSDWILTSNQSNLSVGSYTYSASSCDLSSNCNSTETRSLNILSAGDFISPQISFVSPTLASGTSSSNTSVIINTTISEPNFKNVSFNWNGTSTSIYDDSLVLMHNFDNLSAIGENSTKVVDVSNSFNNGTVFGSSIWSSLGKYNGAYQFDGIDDYIYLGNPASLQFLGTTQRTISAWVKLNSVSTSWITAVSSDAAGIATLYRLQLDDTAAPNRKFAFVMKNSVNQDQVLRSSVSVSTNTWYHLTGVYTGTQMILYVNGVPSGTPITMTPLSSSLVGVYVGDNSGGNQKWNGSIDEVRIYNRSLSSSEVSQLYNSNLAKINSTDWNLISNQSNLSVGSYTYSTSACDKSNNCNSTESRSLNIFAICQNNLTNVTTAWTNISCLSTNLMNQTRNVTTYDANSCGNYTNQTIVEYQATQYCQFDSLSPLIQIVYPLNQNYNINVSSLNYTVSDLNLQSCGYSLTNSTFKLNINGFSKTSSTAYLTNTADYAFDGNVGTFWWSNGTATGNWINIDFGAGALKQITKIAVNHADATSLSAKLQASMDNSTWTNLTSFTHPAINTWYNETFVNANAYRYYRLYVDSVSPPANWIKINEWELYSPIEQNISCDTNLTGLSSSQGNNTWSVFAIDISGNVNSSSVVFYKDTIAPQVNFVSPTPINNFNTTNTSAIINVSISESNLKNLSFNWNGTSTSIYDDSLVLMHNMDNSTTLIDASRYGKNGTAIGATFTTSGKYDGAYNFNGINNYIAVTPLNITTNTLTVSFWMKGRPTGDYTGIVFSRNSSQPWGVNYRSNSGQLSYHWNDNAASTYDWVSGLSPTANSWTFVTLSISPSQATLYMSNASGLFSSVNSIAHSQQYLNASVYFGQDAYGPSRSYNGTIDEVKIYNRTLSASEVRTLYHSNLAKINSTDWILISNQSNLSVGSYTYSSSACDISNNCNLTESRLLNIEQPLDIIAPSVIFDSQRPADINSLNIVFGGLNISYNITDAALNLSKIQIYYKQNSTTRNVITFVNGSEASEWGAKDYTSNISSTFLFRLFDREVYPATYNLPESTMNPEVHTRQQLNTSTSYVSIEMLNVTNTTQYNLLEIMSNSSSIQQFYYCNSSYNFSGESLPDPTTSPRCVLFNTLPLNSPYNHTHTVNSKHQIVPLTINTTTGMVGNVVVTPKSYFLLRGNTGPSSEVNFYTIPNISRIGAMRTTTDNGGTWTNQSYTVDSHLHQFSGASSLYYYVCANDTSNNQNCSSLRSDLYEFAGLYPTAVNVYSPTNISYSNISLVTINYTKSESPNGYAIVSYNISLVDENDSYVKTIRTNNGVNLSYVWDSTGTSAGNYGIRVVACDVFAQCSSGYSQIFNLTETDVLSPVLTVLNYSGYHNESVMLQFNAIDNFGISYWSINDTSLFLINQSGYLTNSTSLSAGNYSLNVTVNDTSNNLASGISLINILQACIQNLTNSSFTDWINQTSCRTNDTTLQNRSFVEYDFASCGFSANLTHYEYQEVSCNYCSYNVTNVSAAWTNVSCLSSDLMNQTRNITEYDSNYNSCYLATLLPSDLFNSGNNNTYTEYQSSESCNYQSPEISSIGYVVISNQATITWNTNENANSIVYYGLNENTTSNVSSTSLVTSHSLDITGLSASTLYYYNVSSCDSFGVCVISNQSNFTTASQATSTPTSSSGGGGGFVSPAVIKKEISGFNVSTNLVELPNVAVGVLTYKVISLENLGNTSISFSIDLGNLSSIIKFDEDNFVLSPYEKREIEFVIVPEKEAGSYSGKIVFSSQGKKYEVPVLITIKSEKSLFDIMLYISDENKLISAGEKLSSQITLIQAGLVEKEDVTLNYEIKDFSGNTYVRESETVMVYSQKEFTRFFQTQNLPAGEYVLNAQVVYSGGIAPASTHFAVKERPNVISNYGLYAVLVVAVLVVIILSSLIIRYKKAIAYNKSKEN